MKQMTFLTYILVLRVIGIAREQWVLQEGDGLQCVRDGGKCIHMFNNCSVPLTDNNDCPHGTFCCTNCSVIQLCNDGYGVCRESCHNVEYEVLGGCVSSACKCCTPREALCPPSDKCPGICMNIKFCRNPLANHSCIGPDCICCDKCSVSPVCDDGYGVCRSWCFKEEREVTGGCDDSDCKCCTTRLATCPASSNCSGICIDTRRCFYPLANNFCSGSDCVCCNKCNAQPFCDDGNGVCREWCHSDEREMEGGCSVSGCKCCTLREVTCNISMQCPGICMDSRMCTKPLINSLCSGSDCICCDKCNAQPFCDDGDGVCRDTCLALEHEVKSSCGNSGCKCCTLRKTVCHNTVNCPGICIQENLCFKILDNHTCSGDYCVCCDKCNVQTVCDDSHGVCRTLCESKERDVGVCGNTGCRCCTSRMTTCTNTTECPGICMDKTMCTNPLRHYECSHSDCICCDSCNVHPFCNDGHGVCRESCSSMEREVKGSCGQSGCKCCSYHDAECHDTDDCPGICMDRRLCKTPLNNYSCDGHDCTCCDKCGTKPFCDEGFGVCRESCNKRERQINGDCGHTACKCCTTRLAKCSSIMNKHDFCVNNCTFLERSLGTCKENCSDRSHGICVDFRKCSDPLEHQCCSESDCVCCNKCNAEPFCDDGHGVCKERCATEELELHRGCEERDCKCCTSRLATCSNINSCPGECRDPRLCFKHIDAFSCQQHHCICCDTCGEEDLCDNGQGKCRLSCLSMEGEVGGCQNRGCKCCTVRLANCSANLDFPDICIDSRVCSASANNNLSCGADNRCTSCDVCGLHDSECQQNSHTGACRSSCQTGETANGKCFSGSCSCCYVNADCGQYSSECVVNSNKGVCRSSCLTSLDEVDIGKCSSGSCICCYVHKCELYTSSCSSGTCSYSPDCPPTGPGDACGTRGDCDCC